MSPKTHLMLVKGMFIAFFVAAGAAALAFALGSGPLGEELIWFGVSDFIMLPVVLLAAPVRCDAAGCTGWMKRNWIEESNDMVRLQYQCRTCYRIVDTGLRFGGGGADPWW